MKDETKALLKVISLLMCLISFILFFINLFDSSIDDAYLLRTKIICGLMVGIAFLKGIVISTENKDQNE